MDLGGIRLYFRSNLFITGIYFLSSKTTIHTTLMRNKTQQRQQQEMRLHPLLTYPNNDSQEVDQHQPLILLDVRLFQNNTNSLIQRATRTENRMDILYRELGYDLTSRTFAPNLIETALERFDFLVKTGILFHR